MGERSGSICAKLFLYIWNKNYFAQMKCLIKYIAFLFLLTSCNKKQDYFRFTGHTMGTYYAITVNCKDCTSLKDDIEKVLHEFNQSVSTYIPSSIIGRFNKSSYGVSVNPHRDTVFLSVLQKGLELKSTTEGALNVFIMPLVNYWGFGFEKRNDFNAADSIKVRHLLSLVRDANVRYVQGDDSVKIVKNHPEVQMDFSSIAKGYGIDVIAAFLDNKGIENYLIDIGGEARAKGINSHGKIWTIGINTPQEKAGISDIELVIKLDGKSIATSGNYRNYYLKKGRKYAHIIDPVSGFPALSNLLSASVIYDDCMTADGIATALMVMGLERAKEFLSAKTYPACLIYDEDGDESLEKMYFNGFDSTLVQGR